MSTHRHTETIEALPGPRVDEKEVIGRGSRLDADEDFVWVTEAVRGIDWDKGGRAGETIIPGLEAVLRACVEWEGDGPVVEDVSDLIQRRDGKRAAIEELAARS